MHNRTSRSLRKTAVVVLVVFVISVLMDAVVAGDERTDTGAERRDAPPHHRQQGHHRHQHSSDCSAVRQFARQTMHYSNALPASKSHGMCTLSLSLSLCLCLENVMMNVVIRAVYRDQRLSVIFMISNYVFRAHVRTVAVYQLRY